MKELKCYEEVEHDKNNEPTTTTTATPTASEAAAMDNVSELQEELLLQKQLTDEYNIKVSSFIIIIHSVE